MNIEQLHSAEALFDAIKDNNSLSEQEKNKMILHIHSMLRKGKTKTQRRLLGMVHKWLDLDI